MRNSFHFRRLVPLLAVLSLTIGTNVLPASAAHHSGGLIIVTTSADLSSCPNGPGEPGYSLRCAITYENTNGGGDEIIFRISTSPTTTVLRSALPALTVSNTEINGYEIPTDGTTPNTNSLAQGDNAVIGVTIDGHAVESGLDGIVIDGSNDVVEGIRLVGFKMGANENGGYAVALEGPVGSGGAITNTGDVVEGNFIGSVDNSATIPSNTNGIGVFGGNVGATIGGTSAADANVISGNVADGVESELTNGTTLENNYVGTTPAGTVAAPNGTGVQIVGDKPSDAIGTPGMGNVISGNTGWGVFVGPWALTAVINASGGTVQGNIIGTNAAQSAALANGSGGVELDGNTNMLVGGTTLGPPPTMLGIGNVIAGNGGPGVYLTGGTNQGNDLEGNDIGVTFAGAAMGNQADGVKVDESASFDSVGINGNAKASNTIADNTGFGVNLGFGLTDPVHVSVNLNSMYGNGSPGINLNGQDQLFCTAGLAYVANTTPDDLTPCPLVLAATPQKVVGEACTGCTVEVFISGGAGDDEGKTLLGVVKAGICPASGPCLNFTPWTLPAAGYSQALTVGEYITVTSTSVVEPYSPAPGPPYAKQTSSFSRNVPVGTTLIVNTTQDLSAPCSSSLYSLRCALSQADADHAGDEIDFNIPSAQCSPQCVITPTTTALPTVKSNSTFINGYTQPGSSPNTNTTLNPGDNAVIKIAVNGSSLSSANAFQFVEPYDSAEGLAVGNFAGGDGFLFGEAGFAAFDIVAGSYIGTLNGTTAAPNLNGQESENRAYYGTVGGRAFMDDNVIGGNTSFGVLNSGPGGSTMRENLIGMNAADHAKLPNGYDGVLLFGSTLDLIGGIRPDEGNVISGNFNNGIEGLDAKQASIEGNEIGVDGASDPGVKVGNGFAGVFLYLGANNLVGDLPFGVGGNVIAGNAADGVDVLADSGDLVAGNVIGYVQPNGGNGVTIGNTRYVTGLTADLIRHSALSKGFHVAGRRNATVGGETPMLSGVSTNVIAGNGKLGVFLGQSINDNDVHVLVSTNSMFSNGAGEGLRFFGGGSYCGTPSNGVNDALNCPFITNSAATNTVQVTGTGCDSCLIEVFTATEVAADNGYGEGKVFLGATAASASGKWTLNIASWKLAAGTYVTATQTQLVPISYAKLGGYFYETSQFAQNTKLSNPAGGTSHGRITVVVAGGKVRIRSRVNWALLKSRLLERATRAWPHYHVRFRPLNP